jgi:hypothetical protein
MFLRNASQMSDWKTEIEKLLSRDDHAGLAELARANTAKVLRYLSGRLYSSDEEEKWRAVRTLGMLAADPALLPDDRLAELLRRYFWSLNDESGAVPFGIPEAIGEILARRPDMQNGFLPMLCSLIKEEEVFQTGAIERGVIWALGRVGPAVSASSPETVLIVEEAARKHPDPETRKAAAWALSRFA